MTASAEPEFAPEALEQAPRGFQSQEPWHIVSYPRSGNHLVRAILEAYTNQPTEGCIGSKRDIPICHRAANKSKIIQKYSDRPIGYKAHFVREIHERDKIKTDTPMGMVLITRDPVAAISSHTTRMLSNRRKYPWLSTRQKRAAIQTQIDLYLSLVFRYVAQEDGPKVHVRFEDLICKETADQAAEKLLSPFGVCLAGPSLSEVSKIAKESQKSLSAHRHHLKEEIEQVVRRQLSYEEVLNYVQDTGVN